MYKVVFLDWDDTLGDWATSAERAHRDMYEKHHWAEVCDSFDVWLSTYRQHNVELWERYSRGEITRDFLLVDQFLWPLCHFMGMQTDSAPEAMYDKAQQLGEEYVDLTNRYCCPKPDAEEVVRYLASKYSLTLISNGFREQQYHKIEAAGLLPFFKHIVLSEEVGVMKPSPEIFDIAINQNKQEIPDLIKEETIMVGDSYSSDISGAKTAGIDTIWVNESGTTDYPTEGVTHIVSKLRDVMTIL